MSATSLDFYLFISFEGLNKNFSSQVLYLNIIVAGCK